jgi:crossover junction endodeoxyribonuclease RusA
MTAPRIPFAAIGVSVAPSVHGVSGGVGGSPAATALSDIHYLPQLPGGIPPVVGAFSLTFEITLPWPSAHLSQNGRGSQRRKWALIREYRKACAEAAWKQGVNPTVALRLDAITFCPPADHRYDRDGLIGRFKYGQDGLADAMGVDDNTFEPAYARGPKIEGGAVRVTLTRIPD